MLVNLRSLNKLMTKSSLDFFFPLGNIGYRLFDIYMIALESAASTQ